MFRAMALKELREVRGIAMVGLGVYLLLVISIVSPSIRSHVFLLDMLTDGNAAPDIPFVFDDFASRYWLISLLLAIAIGLRQSVGEAVHGTYLFLLHRPANCQWLMGTKLLVGLATYLVCAAIPIVAYGYWAATHRMLFEWAMTSACWTQWFTMTTVYLGTFLTGIRPGRWYGSRLLPLLATVLPLFLLMVLSENTRAPGPFWQCVVLLGVDIGILVAIFHVTRTRDFS